MARILHLIAADHRRGAETFAVELAEHHRRAGHEVRVLAVERSGAADTLPVEVAGTSRFDPRGGQRIVQAARWSELVVSFGSTSLLTGATAARAVGRPFVYRNIGDPSVWGAARLADLRIGTPVRTARRVVALYPDAARTLIRAYRLDPAAVRIIPRGVPEDRYRPSDDAARSSACDELELDPERRWLAYVGSLSEEKDPMLAVRALAHLPDGVGLVMAGGGPMADAVADAASRHGERCRLLGVVADVAPVYAASDALVLPSHTEGIPGAAVEAGLCGLPVVAFAVGGVPSVVLDGATGVLAHRREPAAFASSVTAALTDRARLGAAARDHCVEGFSMDAVGRAWEQVIDEVLTSPSAGRPRVLQVISSTERRGAEVFARQLGEELDARGADVRTVALRPTEAHDNVPAQVVGRGRFRPLALLRMARWMRRRQVTVVHGGPGLWPATVASALARRPLVYRSIGDPVYWGSVRLGQLRVGVPLRRAAAVVALYPQARTALIDRYRLDPARVLVIPNAVPSERFTRRTDQRRRAARSLLGLRDGPLVGYVGALSAEKRPDWVVEVARRLPEVDVVLAGTGALHDELAEMAGTLEPGRVVLLGGLSEPRALYDAVDVLAVPSRTEGMPASIIEAAMVGTRVVATDVGGVADVLADLGNGHVVADGDLDGFVDAVRAALQLPEPRPADTARYSMADVAGRWAALLERLVSPAGSAAQR